MKMRVDAFRALPMDVDKATKSIDNMTSSIYRSAQRWRTFGYLASIALTAPIVLAGKKAIETASEFEFSMNKIVGLAGQARSSIAGFKKEIMGMALATGQTPTKLAESLYYITSAGFKEGAQALRILEVAARGSTAGLGDMVEVSKLLVFSMNAYKKSGYSATNVADIFTAAVREGALEANDFAGAIQSVIPIASAMGVSLEDVAGSMAAMSLQGASAQNAAVYLKGMLNALLKIKPGGMAEKALKKFGLTAEDLYAELAKPGGLMNVLLKLQELSKKSTGNQFLKEIFRDIRAMTGELSLTGENLEYNEFVMAEMYKSAGSLAKADNAVTDGLKKMRQQLSALGEVINIKLGDDLAKVVLPAFKSILTAVQDLVNAFDRMSDGAKKVVIQVIGLLKRNIK
jgi:TP901 family phage tail tape measure protein